VKSRFLVYLYLLLPLTIFVVVGGYYFYQLYKSQYFVAAVPVTISNKVDSTKYKVDKASFSRAVKEGNLNIDNIPQVIEINTDNKQPLIWFIDPNSQNAKLSGFSYKKEADTFYVSIYINTDKVLKEDYMAEINRNYITSLVYLNQIHNQALDYNALSKQGFDLYMKLTSENIDVIKEENLK
jgi:hypothetical protein